MQYKMSNIYCSVDGCFSQVRGSGVSFFRCPEDPERCSIWKNILGFTGTHRYANITPKQSHNRIRICGLHFGPRSFSNLYKSRLCRSAVPSLRLFTENTENDSYPHEILQKTPDPTTTHHNDELEPNIDLETGISSKRKREEEFELTLSDSRESDAQPSCSQTIEDMDRPLISTDSFISYTKYKELLDAYKILEQQLFHLKNNTDKNRKSRSAFSMISSSSTMVKRTKLGHVPISHSQEEIEELGKQWTDEFSQLSAEQQVYAKEAISEIFNAAKMNNLHSKSVKINDDCADIVSVKTDHTPPIDIFDEHLASTSKGFGVTSVKTEDIGKEIYDDPSTPENVEFGVSVKTEESELDFDTISVKTEETHDVYDENDYRYNQYKTVNFIPDDTDVSVKPEKAEMYEKNSDMSDNRCLLRINEDYSVSNLTSNEIEIYDDHEDDVIKIEKDEII